jgi:hypothetical protein
MIKKIAKHFVQTLADVPSSEIAWAIEKGIVARSIEDEANDLDYPIYDEAYDLSSSRYDVWKHLLTARVVREQGQNMRNVFEEVAEIAAAFGYPEDMNELIYYMPTIEENSEETLMKRILAYAGTALRALPL